MWAIQFNDGSLQVGSGYSYRLFKSEEEAQRYIDTKLINVGACYEPVKPKPVQLPPGHPKRVTVTFRKD